MRVTLNRNHRLSLTRTVVAFVAIVPLLEVTAMAGNLKHREVVAMATVETLEQRVEKAFDNAARVLGPLTNTEDLKKIGQQIIDVVTGREVKIKLEKPEINLDTGDVEGYRTEIYKEYNFAIDSPKAKRFAVVLEAELKKVAPEVSVDFNGQAITVKNNAKPMFGFNEQGQ
ncbi:MAG: hypothetical protein Q7S22_06745 [Candidatus Micrarchaeota archaeon]|nr:hypothetical protein [Candidatus Micrarchaeota archaeon]